MRAYDEACGMTIEQDDAAASVLFQGTRYYFCSIRCRDKFREHPDWYVVVQPEDQELQDI